MEKFLEIAPWIVLGILFFALFYVVHKRFKLHSVWETVSSRYQEKKEQKLLDEAQFIATYGAIENTSFFYKIDRLILTSGLKRVFPILNGEIFLGAMLIAFVLGGLEGILFWGNFFLAIFLGCAQAVAIYVIVLGLSARTYNQIEDGTSIFVSILSNHAKGSSDIVTIMQNTHASLDGPIRSLVAKFIYDAERTGNVDMAFDYMKESVDNRQFQTIVLNLKNCMHYRANYEEVLTQMMGQIAATLSAREERKNILFSMKITLVSISIASLLIVQLIGNGIGVDVKAILTGSVVGQFLLFVTGILYLFVAMKLFVTDK